MLGIGANGIEEIEYFLVPIEIVPHLDQSPFSDTPIKYSKNPHDQIIAAEA